MFYSQKVLAFILKIKCFEKSNHTPIIMNNNTA